MTAVRVIFVQLPPGARAAVSAAATKAFDQVEFADAPSISAATSAPPDAVAELLVTGSGNLELERATREPAPGGAPRWPVVALGSGLTPAYATIPPGEWSSPLLPGVLRQAVACHSLRRENLRLRGDLTTVARRIFHDLRSPVGYIYTTVDVMKELASDPESVQGMTTSIKDSVDEFMQILDRVGFMLVASTSAEKPAPVDMAAIIEEALRHLENLTTSLDATIVLPPNWPEVTAVPTWLGMAWRLLLENSLASTGPQSTVRIEWSSDDNRCRFNIINDGKPLSPSRSVVFTPFEQLHQLNARALGLSMAQRFLNLQGGICGYEETSGHGPCFYFELPATRVAKPQEATL